MKNIPNILSALRILMVGVFIWLFMEGQYLAALSVYVLAFLTDVLDGYLARRNNWITNLGKLLDPLADKLLVLAALFCIYFGKQRPVYLTLSILILLKELLMVIGGALMLRKSIVVYAGWIGKIATGVFGAGVVLSLLSFVLPWLEPWNIYVLIAATLLSYAALCFYAGRALHGYYKTAKTTAENRTDSEE